MVNRSDLADSDLFCDTSYFYALLSKKDSNHQEAKRWAAEIQKGEISCWTTWDIISETLTLLISRNHYTMAMAFLDELDPSLKKAEYGDEIREAAKKTFRRFNKDHSFSFCDCISYHVIRDLLHPMPALSFDEDFRQMGLTIAN